MFTVDDILAMDPQSRSTLPGTGLKHLAREDAQRLKQSDAFASLGKGAKRQVTMLVNGSVGGPRPGTLRAPRRGKQFSKWLAACSVGELTQVLAGMNAEIVAKLSKAIADSAGVRQAREIAAKQQRIEELRAELAKLQGG